MTDDSSKEPKVLQFNLLADEPEELQALISRVQSREEAVRGERARKKRPGRLRGKLEVGSDAFAPMTDDEVREFMGG
jgi:hypothetical protein